MLEVPSGFLHIVLRPAKPVRVKTGVSAELNHAINAIVLNYNLGYGWCIKNFKFASQYSAGGGMLHCRDVTCSLTVKPLK